MSIFIPILFIETAGKCGRMSIAFRLKILFFGNGLDLAIGLLLESYSSDNERSVAKRFTFL